MPETQSPAQNYADRDNIIFPGTRAQADAVEEQAKSETEDRRLVTESDPKVESDQALEVEVVKTEAAVAESERVQDALAKNTEARQEHGHVPVEVAQEQAEQHAEELDALKQHEPPAEDVNPEDEQPPVVEPPAADPPAHEPQSSQPEE
jgi:hypothetical protein